MLPLIIPRSDVESSCLSLDFQQVSTSLMLKLMATGQAKKVLWFTGGQHHFHAMKLAVDKMKILIQKTHEQIHKEREHTLKTDQARVKRDEAIVKMSALIKEKEAFMDSISTWGVILYNEGKNLYIHLNYWSTTIITEMMEVRGNELAIYVSRNKEIKHFPEDECEGMVMFVKLFQMKLESDAGEDELSKWLRKIAQDAKQSVLGQIFNHAVMRSTKPTTVKEEKEIQRMRLMKI